MSDANTNDAWIFECGDLQRTRWESGTGISVEELCLQFEQLPAHDDVRIDLIVKEYCYREVAGEEPTIGAFTSRFPELAEKIREELAAVDGDPETEPDHKNEEFRYEVFEKVGAGGMGTVHRARDRITDRIVALKWIHTGSIPGASLAAQALQEARNATRVTHPSIVQVFDSGVRDGRAFIAMGFIEGVSLAEEIQDAEKIDQHRAAQLMANVCNAVAAAHEVNVTHRDLKPDNILIDRTGIPHVTDFGIARLVDDSSADEKTSQVILGTPQYCSPERLSGGSDRNRPTTDVWSLGVVLYEMLSGKCPFSGKTSGEEDHIPLHRVAAVSRDLCTICDRCLEKSPGDRYVDAGGLGRDLELFLEGEPTLARPVPLIRRIRRWRRRKPAIARLTLLLVSVVAVATAVLSWFAWKERDAASVAEQNQAAAEAGDYGLTLRKAEDSMSDGDPATAQSVLLTAPRGEIAWEWERLNYEARHRPSSSLSYDEHCWALTAIASDPDTDRLATAACDGRLLIWELSSGRRLNELVSGNWSNKRNQWLHSYQRASDEPVGDCITGIEWIPGTRRLVAASLHGVVSLSGKDGGDLKQIATVDDSIYCTALVDSYLMVGTVSGMLNTVEINADASAEASPGQFRIGQHAITAIGEGGTDCIVGTADGEIWSVSPESGDKELIHRLTGRIRSLDVGTITGRKLLAAGSDSDDVFVFEHTDSQWKLAGTYRPPRLNADAEPAPIEGVFLDERVGALVVMDSRGRLTEWDVRSGRRNWSLNAMNPDYLRFPMKLLKERSITPVPVLDRFLAGIVPGANASEIVCGGGDYTARAWRRPSPIDVTSDFGSPKPRLCFERGRSDRLWVGTSDGTLAVLNPQDLSVIAKTQAHTEECVCLCPSYSGVAIGDPEGTVRLWRLDDGDAIVSSDQFQAASRVVAVSTSNDGEWLGTVTAESEFYLWNLSDGTLAVSETIEPDTPTLQGAVSFSGDGQRVAVAGASESVSVYDLSTLKRLPASGRTGGDGAVDLFWLANHPGLLFVANAGPKYETLAVDPPFWPESILLPGRPSSRCVAAEQSPDGKRWFLLEESGRLVVFDHERHGRILTRESGLPNAVSLAVSPDGRKVVAGFQSGTLRLWDTVIDERPPVAAVDRSPVSVTRLVEGQLSLPRDLFRCVTLDQHDLVQVVHFQQSTSGLKESEAQLLLTSEADSEATSVVIADNVPTTPQNVRLSTYGGRSAAVFRQRLPGYLKHGADVVLISNPGTEEESRETLITLSNSGFYPAVTWSADTVDEVFHFSFAGYELLRTFRKNGEWTTEPVGHQGDGFQLQAVRTTSGERYVAFRTNRFNSDTRSPHLIRVDGNTWHRNVIDRRARACLNVLLLDQANPLFVLLRDGPLASEIIYTASPLKDGTWTFTDRHYAGRLIRESFASDGQRFFACGIDQEHGLCLLTYDDEQPLVDILDSEFHDLTATAVTLIDSQKRPVVVTRRHRDNQYQIDIYRLSE